MVSIGPPRVASMQKLLPSHFHMSNPSNTDSSSEVSSLVSEPACKDGCGLLDLSDENDEFPNLETLNAHLARSQAKLINSGHLER